MSNRVYDVLKYVALIGIPALGTLINTLGSIWDWTYTEAISGTIAAVGVFLGALLQISSSKYFKKEKEKGE